MCVSSPSLLVTPRYQTHRPSGTNTQQAPGDSCWPSDDAWNKLNATLSGRLITASPPASVCYESQPDYDPSACELIISQWNDPLFHRADPISIDYPFWAEEPCPPIYPNGTGVNGDPEAGEKGCSLGAYPAYVVNATSSEDVSTAMKWAQEQNIRLNIKSTGHSHLGR